MHRLRLTFHFESAQAPASGLSNIFLILVKGFSLTALKILPCSLDGHLISSTLECAHPSASHFTHFSFQQTPRQMSRTQTHSHIIKRHTQASPAQCLILISYKDAKALGSYSREPHNSKTFSHHHTHMILLYTRVNLSACTLTHGVLGHILYLTTLYVQRRSGPLSLMAEHTYWKASHLTYHINALSVQSLRREHIQTCCASQS